MVARGGHDHHGHVDVHQRHRGAGHAVLPRRQGVVQEQRVQVLGVHARGQAGGVGVPAHQIEAGVVLAQQVAARITPPQQAARGQENERAAHLLAREVAALIHAAAQGAELALVNEDPQLARLREVGLRRQQDDGGQLGHVGRDHGLLGGGALLRLAVQAPQDGRDDGQERAAKAVAHGVHTLGAAARLDGRQGFHDAQTQVILHAQLPVAGIGVAPRDDEHGVPLVHQVLDHGVVRRHVQDVVLHDARRHDEHGLWLHLLGAGAVLDEFDQVVAKHHLARGNGHLLAHGVLQRLQLLCGRFRAGIGLLAQILQEKLPALLERCAVGFLRHAQHLGVGQRPVGRRQRIQRLAREKVHHVLVVARHAAAVPGGFAPPGVSGLEAFFDGVVRPLGPARIGETAIFLRHGVGRLVHGLVPGVYRQFKRTHGQLGLAPWRCHQVHCPIRMGQRQGNRRQATESTHHLRLHRLIQRPCRRAAALVEILRPRRIIRSHGQLLDATKTTIDGIVLTSVKKSLD